MLIPRFGLDGAMWATCASYGLGAVASFALGRRAIALPLPWAAFGQALLASAAMAVVVSLVPAVGGAIELFAKAAVGAIVYGALALALDISGARSRGLSLARGLKARTA